MPADRQPDPDRRATLARTGLAALAAVVPQAWHSTPATARVVGPSTPPLAPTPAMTEGPFYPPAFQPLPVRTLRTGSAAPIGQPMLLTGRLLDSGGRPLEGARIEIWQCDARGHYHHPRDSGAEDRDRDFAGFGWQLAGAEGRYAFETIEPVSYPGRTPHVHLCVRQRGRVVLVSQLFLPERSADNGRDFLWRALGPSQPLALGTDVYAASPGPRRLVFDVVIAG